MASGLVNTARMVGATLSVALMGLFFRGRVGGPAAIASATRGALILAAAAEGLGAAVALTFLRPARRRAAAPGAPRAEEA